MGGKITLIQIKEYILKLKKKSKCKRCGWNKHPEILQFHHRNKKDKKFTIGQLNKYITLKDVLEEIKKCDLLCPNCHYKQSYLESSNGKR